MENEQNAAGVDLNRNFPASTWLPERSRTYPPGIARELRVSPHRTNYSSPGRHAGSEPEMQAPMALFKRLRSGVAVDMNSQFGL